MIQTSFFPQPEKDKPIQIIQKIDTSILQPRKVEEVIPEANILPDTYIIYPEGGYHPFYGVKNSFPIYQLPIWPYIKRIKYSEYYRSEKTLKDHNIRGRKINHPNSQLNFDIKNRYVCARLYTTIYHQITHYTKIKKNGQHATTKVKKRDAFAMHGLIAHAYIPNPDNKPQIMHVNGDPTNYLPENLKWGTQSENMKGVKKMLDTPEQKYLDFVNKGLIKG